MNIELCLNFEDRIKEQRTHDVKKLETRDSSASRYSSKDKKREFPNFNIGVVRMDTANSFVSHDFDKQISIV